MKPGFLDIDDRETFILRDLEILNWGPFSGKHRAEFDKRGTAIIGSTGSGKTTLVDALMTLIADNPRYNLASTGGHDKNDRSLISYIRGVGGGAGGDKVARPGKTITGIAATYRNQQQIIRAIAIFWLDSTSNSQQDIKRRFFISEDSGQNLDLLLRQWEQDGARQLMRHSRETAGLRAFESKRSYLAQLRSVFDVSENAFNLLNRAAGLKQLDSVDMIFRELVLDDKSAFKQALEVAADFDNLAAIHKELEDARAQKESLLPIATANEQLQKQQKELSESNDLKRLIPRWYAQLGVELYRKELERLEAQKLEADRQFEIKKEKVNAATTHEQTLQQRYLELGGSDIDQLEETINAQKELLKTRERAAEDYKMMVRALGLSDELSATQFEQNKSLLVAKRPELEKALEQTEDDESESRSQLRDARQECERLKTAIREVKASPGSNIPPNFQHFRRNLAEHLRLNSDDLPFVAELVEVKTEEAVWRGAIERAIGANRLRILVPQAHLRDALKWINHRDNKLHVRLQEACVEESEKDYFFDSFIHKLNIKQHPLRLALENLLARQDYHCVPDSDTLSGAAHGLTVEGSMSGVNGRFDKPDKQKLHEGWLTGFNNRDQLKALARKLVKAEEAHRALEPRAKSLLEKRKQCDGELRFLENALKLEFNQIDAPGTFRSIQSLSEKIAELKKPGSEAGIAKAAYEDAKKATESRRKELSDIRVNLGVMEKDMKRAEVSLKNCLDRLDEPITEIETKMGKRHLDQANSVSRENLDQLEREANKRIDQQIEGRRDSIGNLEKRLISFMEKARVLNEGAYVDAGTDLDSIPVYLKELQKLVKEALPDKQKRFLEYLNRSSDQGVTQLLAHIDQEVDTIERRIEDLNHTLAKVDFRGNHYLKLRPQRLNDLAIRELNKARRHLRSAVLKEDGGRSHYSALRKIVEILRDAGNNRHLVGSRALLDPRYRLQFFVVEVDRDTGKESTGRTGSQSDSGGEKELMTSHILTASLSYALCPSGASRPLYGSIILDEAFSKSSQSAASLIVNALRVFGLYPIFVTPNKEISLLKKHTRRAICVQRLGSGSCLATITWEKLTELQPDTMRGEPTETSS